MGKKLLLFVELWKAEQGNVLSISTLPTYYVSYHLCMSAHTCIYYEIMYGYAITNISYQIGTGIHSQISPCCMFPQISEKYQYYHSVEPLAKFCYSLNNGKL